MTRIPNKFGGGVQTNRNGLLFEQTTSLNNALINAGFYRQNGEGFNEDIHLYDNPYKPIIEVVIH